jgi:ribosomal protein L11 methyltransferase
MNSIQIRIKAGEEQQEILISDLSDLGAEGFEQQDEYLIAYFNEHRFKSYEVNQILKGFDFNTGTVAEQNWNEVWESNFQPVIVDDFCAVRAHFHQSIKSVQHEIVITPKMSFGTGHHATTFMMISEMRNLDFNQKKVFDFGTGTGILSILAEKCGAWQISAIDVDKWSIENAKENIESNECKNISVELSSVLPGEPFDIFLANINRNVIMQYLPSIEHCLQKNSYLLLSGLLTTDENDITEACSKTGLHLVKKSERNNWICLLFTK